MKEIFATGALVYNAADGGYEDFMPSMWFILWRGGRSDDARQGQALVLCENAKVRSRLNILSLASLCASSVNKCVMTGQTYHNRQMFSTEDGAGSEQEHR